MMRQTAATRPDAAIGAYQPCDRRWWSVRPPDFVGQRQLGAAREVVFWDGWIALNGKTYTQPNPLHPRIVALIAPFAHRRPVTVLDIGSGPCSLIGDSTEDVLMTCVDELADEYRLIWAKYGLTPYTVVERQDMASLTFPDASFDLVHCSNALDHSADPYRAIQEMVRVCKPGGVVYLLHLTHAARMAHYSGLHQWNVEYVGDDVAIHRREPSGNRFLLSACAPGFRSATQNRGSRVEAIYEKPI